MVEKANYGHQGGAMGGADFINVLFSEFLVYNPENPRWEGRDRFFLDQDHMSPMLYSTLALTGKFTLDELKEFRPGKKMLLTAMALCAFGFAKAQTEQTTQNTLTLTLSLIHISMCIRDSGRVSYNDALSG